MSRLPSWAVWRAEKNLKVNRELTEQKVRNKLKAIQSSYNFLNVIFHQVRAWNLPGLQTKCIFFLPVTFTHEMPQWLTWQGPKGSTEFSTATETQWEETFNNSASWHILIHCSSIHLSSWPLKRPSGVLRTTTTKILAWRGRTSPPN